MTHLPIRPFPLLALLGLLMFATSALSHRVNIFAYVEGETVHVECAYSRSQPVLSGDIEVRNGATGKVYLSGKTDDKGRFSFTVPPQARAEKADLNLLLRAGEGHQNEWTVKAGEYLAEVPPPPAAAISADAKPKPSKSPLPAKLTATSSATSPAKPPATALRPAASAASPPVPCVSDPALAALVEAAVEKKIAPVRQMLAESRIQEPGITEIVGGIGYLVGMAGLLAYVRGRGRGGS